MIIFCFCLCVHIIICVEEWEWRFRKGFGIFNSIGKLIPSSINDYHINHIPRSRQGHISWIIPSSSSSNNELIYIFGGLASLETDRSSTYAINDFWVYNPLGNEWKYIMGKNDTFQAGIYPPNLEINMIPGSRYGMVNFVKNSMLYMYGGIGHGSTIQPGNYVVLGDMWYYDISKSVWKCVTNFCDEIGNVQAEYVSGVLTLGSRYGAVIWQFSNNEIYTFGGSGFGDSNLYGPMDDLWKFTESTKKWSFESGSTDRFGVGSYMAHSTHPPSMYGGISWVLNDELYLFGGKGLSEYAIYYGYPTSSQLYFTSFNNLFSYSTQSKSWRFLGGKKDEFADLGNGENPMQTSLGEKPINRDESNLVFNNDNWPGNRMFANGFVYENTLILLGGVGQAFDNDTSSTVYSKVYTNMWIYSTELKQWKIDSRWRFGDGEGGHVETKDEFHDNNFPGSRHMASGNLGISSFYWLFGWAADSKNVQVGAFHDCLFGPNDEIWEFNVGIREKLEAKKKVGVTFIVLFILFLFCCVIGCVIFGIYKIKKSSSEGGKLLTVISDEEIMDPISRIELEETVKRPKSQYTKYSKFQKIHKDLDTK